MAHNRNSAFDHPLNGIRVSLDAFELDSVGPGPHQHRGGIESRGDPFPKREKGHVGDQEFARCAARDGRGVEAHEREGHRKRRGIAVHDHAGAIPDEDAIESGAGEEAGEGIVVARDHGELAALGLRAKKIGRGHGSPRGKSG